MIPATDHPQPQEAGVAPHVLGRQRGGVALPDAGLDDDVREGDEPRHLVVAVVEAQLPLGVLRGDAVGGADAQRVRRGLRPGHLVRGVDGGPLGEEVEAAPGGRLILV